MSPRRALAALVGAAVLLAACAASVSPQPTAEERTPAATASAAASASATAAESATQVPGPGWPQAGLPYDGAEILDAMRSSRRPGGVPDALETDPVAQAVAERLWTIDGTAWDTIAASGSCTSATACRLELSGSRSGWLGEDVWVLDVDPSVPTIGVADTTLGSVPPGVATDLEGLAASLVDLEGLGLTSVRWTPPPDDERFELSYRDAGEEGGCTVELALDAVAGMILDEQRSGC